MAFMIPVVRKEWDVYGSGNRSRPSPSGTKSCSRSRQVSECRSEGPSLSTSPSNGVEGTVIIYSTGRKRSLAMEIRNQQHRLSVGSLPSTFHSGHLSLPTNNGSPHYLGRPRSSTPRMANSLHGRYRSRNSEPPSPAKGAISLPSSEGASPPKIGSQSSLQKFHNRLVDRLRRSLRLHSEENSATENGSRASS